jgi:NAD(P)-dependent dehydrogenase (short-subunit alcohol dehydrogenase family)
MRLKDKVAVITGSGSGIGLATAKLFSENGAKVVIAERDVERGLAVERELTASGAVCLFVQTDVSEPDSMEGLVRQCIDRFTRIDVLYNNAGGSSKDDGPVHSAPIQEFWNRIKVDLFGAWLGCHFVLPHMIRQGGGSIINATSVLALIGTPGKDAYTTAKGGVISLTRSMAVEYAEYNIRVNAIAPGGTATERVLKRIETHGMQGTIASRSPLGLIEPVDIANAVLYLASDESRKMTGQVMVVDSGFSIS